MSRLMIEPSTPLCLLQDAGRFGVRHLGVTQGGASGLGFDALGQLAAGQCAWMPGGGSHPGRALPDRQASDAAWLWPVPTWVRGWTTNALAALAQLCVTAKASACSFTHRCSGARAYLAAPGGLCCAGAGQLCLRWCVKALGGPDGWAGHWPRASCLGYSGNAPACGEVP